MRYGLVGFGRFGELHARFIAGTPGAELAAVCVNSDAGAAAVAAAHPGVAIRRDPRALIADERIDAVDIVVPNHLHADLAVAALEAGKHVLLEKPMATTLVDCERIVAAAEASRGVLSVGFELRLSTQWGRIKELIDDGAIGRPRFVSLDLFRHPYRRGADGWRFDPDRVGSWILEEPIHWFDMVMWYMAERGAPVAVTAAGTPSGERGMYDNFSALLRFPDDGFAAITQSLAGFGHHLTLEITGDRGAIRSTWSGADAATAEPLAEVKLLRAGADAPETVPLASRSGELFELEEEIRLTTEAFRAGRPLVGAEEARRAVVVCLEAERAVQEGRSLPLRF